MSARESRDAARDPADGEATAGGLGADKALREALPASRPHVLCDLCGHVMLDLHCKLVCERCGYKRDCSDP